VVAYIPELDSHGIEGVTAAADEIVRGRFERGGLSRSSAPSEDPEGNVGIGLLHEHVI